jgi:hypothetical protein
MYNYQYGKLGTKHRMSDFAELILPIAEGMLEMAKVDPESVKMIHIEKENWWVPRHHRMVEGRAIVLINRDVPADCGCMQPQGASFFSPSGQIGIRAIVLSHDPNNHAHTQMGVVLPIRHRFDDLEPGRRKSGFIVVRFDREGFTNGDTYIPIEEDPEYLMKVLGLHEDIPTNGCFSMRFDETVGKPDARVYLANTLPHLKEYLSSLAEKLANKDEHKH